MNETPTPFVLVDENDQPLQPVRFFPELSPREEQVVRAIAHGLSTNEIATECSISEKTVHSHRGRAFDKLHVDNNVQLCLLAVKRGAVTP